MSHESVDAAPGGKRVGPSEQIELIRRAQCGDKRCLELLAAQARQRLHTYVYRLTQQDELAQEIVQESLFEMCKVLGKLKSADRFWPWLHGIATNKLRRHYRTERTQRNLAAANVELRDAAKGREDGLEKLVGEELKHIVWSAMQKLRTRYKAVLIMRCYDDMAYSDIAEAMGCSEFSTRMLFLRAKRSLQRELMRNGFKKGSLLAALALFGKITAPSKAAAAQVTVSTTALKVGTVATIAGVATTKTAIISLAAAGAITAGVATTSNSWHHGGTDPALTGPQVAEQLPQAENTRESFWYYFPQGPSGPLMVRGSWQPADGSSPKRVLQNDQANYLYSDNTLNVNNQRMLAADLSVLTLPTDDPGMIDFICKIEGRPNTTDRIRATGRGLMVIAERDQDNGDAKPWAIRHYNAPDEDYFRSDWPASVRPVDNRDTMHKRGWTYFRISGQINGHGVWGTGRIPFVYSRLARYSPWLRLQIGSLTIADTYRDAYIKSSASDQLRTYRAGSFFKGLLRPWAGYHVLDTIRRDAAEQRIPFETRYTPGDKRAEVELDCQGVKVVYNIDLETDVIDEITFSTDRGPAGNLRFSYLQSIEDAGGQFVFPSGPSQRMDQQDDLGLRWLVELVEGSLE